MTPTPPRAAVPAQPDALQPIFMEAMEWGKYFWAPNINVQAETLRVVAQGFASKAAATLTAQGAAERAVPASMCLHCGATEGAHYIGRCGSVMGATRYTAPAHGQTPAQTEHAAAGVSENGRESNMTGGAYAELPEGWPARFRCDSCDGNGEVGDPMYMGHFQPPERARCPDCDGRGWCGEEPAFSADHMRDFADRTHALRASHAQAPAGATTAGAKTDAVMKLVDELVRATTSKNSTHAQYMGKAMPDDVYERFATLRDEFIPKLRDKLRAMVTPTAQAAPAADHDGLRCAVGNCTFNGEVEKHATDCPSAQQAEPAAGAVAGPDDLSGTLRRLDSKELAAWVDRGMALSENLVMYVQADCTLRESQARDMLRAHLFSAQPSPQAAPTPAAQADSGVQEDAARKARLAGMHKFLEWNRGQGTARPVPGPCEYSVFNQAVDIYCAALAAKGQKP